MREDWIEVELGEVCEDVLKVKRNDMDDNDSFLYFDIGGIDNKSNKIVSYKNYKWKDAPSRAQQIIKFGDTLFSTVRTYLKNIAIVDNIKFENQVCSSGFTVIRSKKDILNPSYINYYALSEVFLQPLNELQQGSSYPAVRDKDVFSQIIPLAPLPIQRAIVSKIEALFSDLDNGIANFKKAQAQLKIYRQAVLKKAFEGELTKAWRERQSNLPTAEDLLKQIKEERQNHYNQQVEEWEKAVEEWEDGGSVGKKPSKPTQPKELSPLKKGELEDFPELPVGWAWVKLGSFAQNMCLGKMLDKEKNQGDFKFYLGNINVRWGEFDLINLKKMKFLNTEIERFNVIKGDLIICEGGEPGRCAIWKSNDTIMIQKALHRVRFYQTITNSSLIFHFFKYAATSGHLANNFTGTTIKHLTGQGLEKLIIPICSIQEQTQTVQEIESRLSVCDKMEQSITESIAKAEALRQSILKKAFEGKLLSQAEIDLCKKEADYEPAGELLKKIKAEKLTKEQAKKQPGIKNKTQK